MTRTIIAALAIVGIAAGAARADNKSKADELFKRAKKLLADKKYAEACPKFEESYQLDPGIGGELNIGRCYEEWGKLAHAYHAYVEAERQAKAANDERVPKIHALVTAIEPAVPRLVIHVPAGVDPATIRVTIDGVAVATGDLASPQLVDPGPKQVAYTSHGVKKQTLVPIERGGTAEVALDLPKPAGGGETDTEAKSPESAAPTASTPGDATPPGHWQRLGGIALGGAGLVGVGVAAYLALSARSDYNNALGADCMNMKDACDPQGLTATHDARSRANAATIVGALGLAAIAGGVVLYLFAPDAASGEHAYYVVPTTNGLAVGGRL